MGDEPKIRVTPSDPADAERAARLQRHYNWLYESNRAFRETVDKMPTRDELLLSIALHGSYPPPAEAGIEPDSHGAPEPESPPDSDA